LAGNAGQSGLVDHGQIANFEALANPLELSGTHLRTNHVAKTTAFKVHIPGGIGTEKPVTMRELANDPAFLGRVIEAYHHPAWPGLDEPTEHFGRGEDEPRGLRRAAPRDRRARKEWGAHPKVCAHFTLQQSRLGSHLDDVDQVPERLVIAEHFFQHFIGHRQFTSRCQRPVLKASPIASRRLVQILHDGAECQHGKGRIAALAAAEDWPQHWRQLLDHGDEDCLAASFQSAPIRGERNPAQLGLG
jgi:hypothetical protein